MHQFKIRALTQSFQGNFSSVLRAYAAAVPVASPVQVIESSRSTAGFMLEWSAAISPDLPILGYKILRDNGNSSAISIVGYEATSNPSLSGSIPSLESGSYYRFQLYALNAAGWSEGSDITGLRVGKLPPPLIQPPYATSISSSSLAVTWQAADLSSASGFLKSYRVYINETLDQIVPLNITSATISATLLPGYRHTIQVAIENDLGVGALSPSLTLRTVDDLPSPSNFRVVRSDHTSCTLSWDAITPPSHSQVSGYMLLSNDGKGSEIAEVAYEGRFDSATRQVTVSSLKQNALYEFQVKGIDNQGTQGARSTIQVCHTIGQPGVPGAPFRINSNETSLQIGWDAPISSQRASVSHFVIEADEVEGQGVANSEQWKQVCQTTSSLKCVISTSANLTLSSGKHYRVRVKAVGEKDGNYSSVTTFTAERVPTPVTISGIKSLSQTSIKLEWSKPASVRGTELDIMSYEVYASTQNRNYSLFTATKGGDEWTQSTLYGLTSGLAYSFKVIAINTIGRGDLRTTSDFSFLMAADPAQGPALHKITSSKVNSTTASITIGWSLFGVDSGGVPLKEVTLFYRLSPSGTVLSKTLSASQSQATIQQLELDKDHEFWMSLTNAAERKGLNGTSLSLRAAGQPSRVALITLVPGTRNKAGFSLAWTVPSDNGGSSIIAYQLVDYENESKIYYFGSQLSTTINEIQLNGKAAVFKIRAINKAGLAAWSDGFAFQIAGQPSPPFNLKTLSVTKDAIHITWQAPIDNGGDPLTSYTIYRRRHGYSDLITLSSTPSADIFSYTDSSVVAGFAYDYLVTANNTLYGESEISPPLLNNQAISIPSGLSAPTIVRASRNSLFLSWNAASDDGGEPGSLSYILQIRENTAGSLAQFQEVYRGPDTLHQAKQLRSGAHYIARVKCLNSVGESKDYSAESVEMVTGEEPDSPRGLKLILRNNEPSIKVGWTAPLDSGGVTLSGFYVYKKNATGGVFERVTAAPSSSNPHILLFKDTDVVAGDTYNYRVAAMNILKMESKATAQISIIAGSPSEPPSSLTVAAITTTTAQLSWGSVTQNNGAAITSFKIYLRRGGVNEFKEIVSLADTSTSSYLLSSLVPGQTYEVRMAASNRVSDEGNLFNGEAALKFTDIISFQTIETPTSPTELHQDATSRFKKKALLRWKGPANDGASGILSYDLSVGGATPFSVSLVHSYLLEGLTPGLSQSVKVRAVNKKGASEWSNEVSVLAGTAPSKISTLQIIGTTRNSISLKWDVLSGSATGGTATTPITIQNYELSQISAGSSRVVYLGSNLNFTSTLLVAGASYEFFIRAINVIGKSPESPRVRMNSGQAPSIPSAPTAVLVGSSKLKFKWEPPFDNGGASISYYDIMIERVSDGVVSNFTSSGQEFDFSGDSALLQAHEYKVKIRAQNFITSAGLAESAFSAAATFQTSDVPSKVPHLSVSGLTRTSATIAWTLFTSPSDLGYPIGSPEYVLEISPFQIQAYIEKLRTTSATSYSLSGISPGSKIKVRMYIVNNAGRSPQSDQFIQILFAEVPTAPSAPQFVSRSGGSTSTGAQPFIQLQWKNPDDSGGVPVKAMRIYVKESSALNYTLVYEGNSTSFKFESDLIAGITYQFTASAINQVGESSMSSDLTVIAATIPPPIPSSSLVLSSKALSGSQSNLTVTWSVPTDTGGSPITGYMIGINAGYGSGYQTPIIKTAAHTNHTFLNLQEGATYNVQIVAINSVYSNNPLTDSNLTYSSPALSVTLADVPGQITGLAQDLEKLKEGSITIKWNAPSLTSASPIQGYNVYKDAGAGIYFKVATVLSLSFTEDNLPSGSQLNYKVAAINIAGEGDQSSPITAYAAEKPCKVESITAAVQSKSTVGIVWQTPCNHGLAITKYWVMEDEADYNFGAPIDKGTDTAHNKTLGVSDAGKVFRMRAAAENALGIGEQSDVIQIYAMDAPGIPGLSVTKQDGQKIELTFITPSQLGGSTAVGFKLYRDQGEDGSPVTLIYDGSRRPDVVFYSDSSNLVRGKVYRYELEAINNAHPSASRANSTVAFGSPPKPISNFPSLVSSSRGGGASGQTSASITIRWSAAESLDFPLTTYRVYIDQGANGTYANPQEIVAQELSFLNLTVSQFYAFKIVAVNQIGESDPSPVALFSASEVPGVPTNLITEGRTRSSLLLAWDKPTDNGGQIISGYILEMNPSGSSQWSAVYNGVGHPTVLSYNVTGLQSGISYRFRAKAVNYVGNSSDSSIVSYIAADAPSSPGQPQLVSSNTTSISFSWTAPLDDGGYSIEKYEVLWKNASASSWSSLTILNVTQLLFTHSPDSSLASIGDLLQYKVRAFNTELIGIDSPRAAFILAGVPDVSGGSVSLLSATASTLTVSWGGVAQSDGGAQISGYKLYQLNFSKGEAGEGALAYDGSYISSITSFIVKVEPGSSYKYSVTAINAVGESQRTSWSSPFLAAQVPPTPTSAPRLIYITNTSFVVEIEPITKYVGSGVKGYILFRDDPTHPDVLSYQISSFYAISLSPLRILVNTTYDSSLQAKQSYKIGYKAENEVGVSAGISPSLSLTLGSLPSALAAPTIDRSLSTNSSLFVKWSAPLLDSYALPISGYKLYKSEGDGYSLEYDGSHYAGLTSHTALNLNTGSRVKFKVTALNSNGEGPPSSQIEEWVCVAPARLSAPTYVSSNDTALTVKWQPPLTNGGCSVTQYELYLDHGSGFTQIGETVLSNKPYINEYTVTSQLGSVGSAHSFKVKATNVIGSVESEVLTLLLGGVPGKPDPVVWVNESSDTSHIAMNFTLPSDTGGIPLTGMELRRDEGQGSNIESVVFSGDFLLSSYIEGNLTKGRMYRYQLRVKNANEFSQWSDPTSMLPASTPSSPPTPLILSVASSSLMLKLDVADDNGGASITAYHLYKDQGSINSEFSLFQNFTPGIKEFTVDGSDLIENSTYRFRTSASNIVGEGFHSSDVRVLLKDPPEPPSNLAVDYSTSGFYVQWDKVENANVTGYLVEAKMEGQWMTVYDGSNDPSISRVNIQNKAAFLLGQKYELRAASVNLNGPGNFSTSLYSPYCGSQIEKARNSLLVPTPSLVSSSQSNIVIEWRQVLGVSSNSCVQLTGYQLEYFHNNTWVQAASLSNSLSTFYNLSRPDGVSPGDLIRFKVNAQFSLLASISSFISDTIYFAKIPGQPTTGPSILKDMTGPTSLAFSISLVSDTGGSTILEYEVQLAPLDLSYTHIVSKGSLNTVIHYTKGVRRGQHYLVRYRAVNVVGLGPWSNFTQIIAAARPFSPPRPSFLTSTNTSISITHIAAPQDTNGSPLTRLRIYTDGGDSSKLEPDIEVTAYPGIGTTYTIQTLTPGKLYRIAISASNKIGESEKSGYISAYASAMPAAPLNFEVKKRHSSSTLELQWDSVPDPDAEVQGYLMTMKKEEDQHYVLAYDGAFAKTATSAIIRGLRAGSLYTFRLYSRSFNGNSTSFASLNAYACTAPSSMGVVSVSRISKSNVTIAWDSAPLSDGGCDITGFGVFRDDGAGSLVNLEINAASINNKPHLNSALLDQFASAMVGLTFKILVRAYNPIGSTDSSPISFTLSDPPSAPSDSPLKSAIVEERNGKLTLTITFANPTPQDGGSPITGYDIQVDNGAGGQLMSLSSESPLSSTRQIQSLTKGRTYRVRYRAENINGKGEYSGISAILAATVPSPPSQPLFVTYNATKPSLTVYIPRCSLQNGGASILAYELQRDAGDDPSSAYVNVTGYSNNAPEYEIDLTAESMTAGKIYKMRVRCANSIGFSLYSSVSFIAAGGLPPPPSSHPRATATSKSSISLQWDSSVVTSSQLDITGYVLYMSSLGADLKQIYRGSNRPDVTSFTVSSDPTSSQPLEPGQSYSFAVKALNFNGASLNFSSTAKFYACSPPSSPSRFAFSEANNSTLSITLQWSPPQDNGGCGILGYHLYRDNASGGSISTEITAMNSSNPSLHSYSMDLSGVASLGDIFRFQISAQNIGGISERSVAVAAAVASLPSKPPSPPSTDHSRTQNGLIIKLTSLDTSSTLNGGSSILLYEIEYDNGKGGLFSNSLKTLALQVILSNTTLSDEYRVRYRAKNFNGWGGYSDIALIRYATYPSPPLALTYVSSNSTTVTIVITPPLNSGGVPILKYEIWKDTIQATDSYSLLKSGSQLVFTVSTSDGLVQGSLYRLKARAENEVGYSHEYSNQLYIGIGAKPSTPSSSPVSTSFNLVSRALSLKWQPIVTAPPKLDITDYTLYIASGLYSTLFDQIYSGTALHYSVVNLTLGGAYQFYYTANNTNGESDPSPISTYYACGAPSALSRPIMTHASNTSISLEWQEPEVNNCPILSYSILRDDGNGGQITTEVPGLSNRPELRQASITGLSPPGNIFRIIVVATNAVGNGTSPTLAVTLASVPDSPQLGPIAVIQQTNLEQISLDLSTLSSSQNGGAPIESYSLEVLIQEEWRILMDKLRTSYIWKIDVEFTPGDYFAFRYRAKNVNGWSGYSPISYIQAATVPSPPEPPEVKLITDANVTLTIRASTNDKGASIDAYFLEKAGLGDAHFQVISGSLSIGNYNYTYEAGEAGKIFRFRTNAHNKIGNSSYSGERVVALGQAPSLLGTSLTLSTLSRQQFEIGWQAATDTALPVLGYKLLINQANGGDPSVTLYDGLYYPNVLSFIIPYSSIERGSSYSFRAIPLNFNGEGIQSSISSFIICSPPSGLTEPQFVTANRTHMEIEWKLPQDMGGCSIKSWYISRNAGDGSDPSIALNSIQNIPYLANTILSFASDGTDAGKSFKIQLSLKNEANQELIADIVEFTLAGVPSTPSEGPTQNKTKSSLTFLFFTLQAISDNGGSPLTSYDVQISVNNEWQFMRKNSLSIEFYFRDTSELEIGKIYMTRFRGSNINGYGDWSPVAYATYGSIPLSPLMPSLVSATNNSLQIQISPPTDQQTPGDGGSLILAYRLEIQHYNDDGVTVSAWQTVSSYPPSGVSSNPAQIPLTHNLTTSSDGIVKARIYRMRTYAQNQFGESQASPVLKALAQNPLPQMSPIVNVTSAQNWIEISWTQLNGWVVDRYEILREGNSFYNATPSETQLNVTGLTGGLAYSFSVRGVALNSKGNSSLPVEIYACSAPQFNSGIQVEVNHFDLSIIASWQFTEIEEGGCSISQFEAYIDDGAGGAFTKTGGSTLDGRPDIRSVAIPGFTTNDSGKVYRVKIRALSSSGYGDSEIASVRMGVAPASISSISLDTSE